MVDLNIDKDDDILPNLSNNKNNEDFCYVCRGNGLEDIPCPSCGKMLDSILAEKVSNFNEEIGDVSKLELIPDFYRNKRWNITELINANIERNEELDFMEYAKVLDRIHKRFEKGIIPNYSAIIISPKKMSKTIFAYSCMKYSLIHNKTVAPLLDLLQMSQEIKSFNKDIILADVLFTVVQQGYTRTSSWQTILELLDIRSRHNKSTFILSEFSLSNISMSDKEKRFMRIIDRSCSGDPRKYPRLLELQDDSFSGGIKRCLL